MKLFSIGIIAALIISEIICFSATARNRYVSPEGETVRTGSEDNALSAGLGEALSGLEPGDTVFILPGIYKLKPADISCFDNPGDYAVVYHLQMRGEKGNPIVIKGIADKENRRPVFDFSEVALKDEKHPEGYRITGFLVSGSYLKLSDFECVGMRVTRTDHTQSENIRISGGAHNTFDNISCHDGMGIGFFINKNSHHNLVLNCDSYNNYDPVSDVSPTTLLGSGGNNDGFGCHVRGGMNGNEFLGCRAWNNSDDGFDLINCYSPVTISYSIALFNGYDAEGTARADGNGFKAGGFGMRPRDIKLFKNESPRHLVINNFAAYNKANGIYSNHHLGGVDFLYNTSSGNRNSNYSMVNRKGKGRDENIDVEGYDHHLEKNLSIGSIGREIIWTSFKPENDLILITEQRGTDSFDQALAPRDADGMLSEITLEYVNSLRREGSGADFSGYRKAVGEAKRSLGAGE